MENWTFIVKQSGETTIMVCREEDCWQVYYKRPSYPFMAAFGCRLDEPLEHVFLLAESNIDEYADMFD